MSARSKSLVVRLEPYPEHDAMLMVRVGSSSTGACTYGLQGFRRRFGPKKRAFRLSRRQARAFLLRSGPARSVAHSLTRYAYPGRPTCWSTNHHFNPVVGWRYCSQCETPTGWGNGACSKSAFVDWLVDALFDLQDTPSEAVEAAVRA